MPILLTTPFNPGDLDPGKTYPRAKIYSMKWIDQIPGEIQPAVGVVSNILIELAWGDLVDGAPGTWFSGKAAPRKTFMVAGDDYTTMLQSLITPEDSGLIYAGVKRVLYQYLIDKGLVAGTIEP
jgi:hypothetical protein